MADEDDDHSDEAEQAEDVCRRLEVFADQGQRIFAAARGDGDDDEQGDDDAHEAFADDEARSKEDAAMVAGFYVFFFVARAATGSAGLQGLMDEVTHDRTDDQRDFQGRRQVNAHADSQWRQSQGFRVFRQNEVDDDGGDTDTDTEEDIVPVEAGTEDTLGDGRHQGCLRSCQGLGRIHAGTGKGAGEAIGLIEQVQDRSDGKGADDRAQDEGDLLFPRCSANNITCF